MEFKCTRLLRPCLRLLLRLQLDRSSPSALPRLSSTNGQSSTVLQIGHSTVRKAAVSDAPSILFVHPSRPSTPRPRPSTGRIRQVVAGAGSSSATFKLLNRAPCSPNHLSLLSSTSGHGIRELTLKFSGFAVGLIGDSSPLLGWIRWAWTRSRGITNCQVRDFLLLDLESRLETYVIASCSLCAIVCNKLFTDRHRCPDVLCIVVVLVGYVVNWNCMSMDFKVLMLGKGTARGRPTRGKKDA
ncbi:hypothetical protein E5676_scaffold808G00080 [Cucumis melo var. makuwa]|uniref:Ty3-gypsy retrotransposon protein n=1 Tax=Cucumis melo var. makuwa TaxID=1194695 RepID=A0A5D3BSX8_CUCMM|nr:hypothetical protein E5676_scaffold808G00080 [Cucumis melo var. makuwa]